MSAVKIAFAYYIDEKGDKHVLGRHVFAGKEFTLRQHNADAYMALAHVRRLTPHYTRTGGKR